jgi:hypothetical protein
MLPPSWESKVASWYFLKQTTHCYTPECKTLQKHGKLLIFVMFIWHWSYGTVFFQLQVVLISENASMSAVILQRCYPSVGLSMVLCNTGNHKCDVNPWLSNHKTGSMYYITQLCSSWVCLKNSFFLYYIGFFLGQYVYTWHSELSWTCVISSLA